MILYTSMSIALHSGIPTLQIQLKSPSFHKKLKQFAMFFYILISLETEEIFLRDF